MDVGKFLDKAEVALRKRNAAQAIALYRQVQRAVPGEPRARQGMLAAFRRQAELKGGPKILDRTAAKGLAVTARGLAAANRHGAVMKTCETGLERNPLDGSLAAMLAQAHRGQGQDEAALATWRYRLELDADDVEALKQAGMLHYELRQIDEAVECLERAHEIDRHDPDVERLRKHLAAEGTLASTRYETARSSRELARDESALRRAESDDRLHRTSAELGEDIETLEAALTAAPDDARVRRRLIAVLIRGGRHDRALEIVDTAQAGAPSDDLLDTRGEIQLAANEKALRAATDDADRRRLREERSRLEIQELSRRVPRNPGDGALRLRLARAYYRVGETDPAVEQFQALAGDARFKLDAQQGLGACFLRKKLYPLAARQFEAALVGAGGVGTDRGKEICYYLGLVCERLGDTPGALDRYLELYEVDINFEDVAAKIEQLRRDSSDEPQ